MASDWLRRDKERIVILDSNAVMMLFEFSIDLEDELKRLLGSYRIIIPKPIFDELKFLSEQGKGKQKFIAKPALELIKRYEIVDAEGKGDQSVLDLAKRLNCIVLTNDRKLREKLKKISLHTVYLRGKKQLVLE